MIDQALILAAGHGSRLRDHVPVTHKALVQIEDEPLLVRTCRMLEQSGLREVVVVTGPLRRGCVCGSERGEWSGDRAAICRESAMEAIQWDFGVGGDRGAR